VIAAETRAQELSLSGISVQTPPTPKEAIPKPHRAAQPDFTMSAEIVSQDPTAAHEEHDDLENGNGAESRGVKRPRTSAAADDDDDDDDKPGRERRKIEIKFIQDKSRRHITFSKRKAGIMKKVRACRRHATRSLRAASAA
jgi:hypothetical protein